VVPYEPLLACSGSVRDKPECSAASENTRGTGDLVDGGAAPVGAAPSTAFVLEEGCDLGGMLLEEEAELAAAGNTGGAPE
jgi:hypothetical protein